MAKNICCIQLQSNLISQTLCAFWTVPSKKRNKVNGTFFIPYPITPGPGGNPIKLGMILLISLEPSFSVYSSVSQKWGVAIHL